MLTRLDVGPLAGAVAGAAAGAARTTAQGLTSVHDTTRRLGHVARNALHGNRHWRAGHRVHLALRHPDGAPAGPVAHKVAAELLDHPDVLTAYWDEGLARLVVVVVEDTAADRVAEHAAALAERLGLSEGPAPEEEEDTPHPGDPREVRVSAAALLLDIAGTGGALAARVLRLPRAPRTLGAGVTLLRENPRFRAVLRQRFGRDGMELVLAAANAVAHGAGQSPAALVLDGLLRTGQLTEAVARCAAFEALHDGICAESRPSIPCPPGVRPPLRVTPAQEYAANAGTGSVAGAAATLLVTHDVQEAAEAVLAGSPKAARYGPAAFQATLGTYLARSGVLVRGGERLRQMEIADCLVLHADALRNHASPTAAPGGGRPDAYDDPVDPFAEAVLDAARRAGLHVVITGGSDLKDITRMADEVAPADLPFGDVVRALQNDGHIVVSVARVAADGDPDIADGLPAADVAIALTDGRSAVAWGADVLAPGGPADVWRLLTAVPASRRVGRRSQTLARAGAALSGLMVARGGKPGGRVWRLLTRHAPVNIAAANALFLGWTEAIRVARATPPEPRLHVPWHAMEPHEAHHRLRRDRIDAAPSGPALLADRSRQRAARLTRTPVLAPARWTWQAAGAVRRELDDPLTPVLATGAVASALLGSLVDALLVVGAMDLNAVAGGLQRLRAEQAVARLAARQRPRAHRQDARGRTVSVDAARLRPGDRISLAAGDVVPADARLLEVEGLEVDESSLTGESLPVTKGVEATPGAPVARRSCMVFEGTTVVAGRGVGLVVGTGEHTEAGRAVALAARTPPPAGVQARLQELTRKALPMTFTGGALVTGLSLLRGSPVRRAVSGGVAVAVAAVPEGLPLVATVAQMAAARRLSRRGVLVRTPRTLEALGRVDTVCFDKTGTLTENRLRLVRVATADGTVLAPRDERAADIVRLAARACPQEENGRGRRVAHATDEAVLDIAPPDENWTPSGELAFEASRGYAAAAGRENGGGELLIVKGAPETVLPACRDLPGTAADTARTLAGQGLRVLAVARRPWRGTDPAAELDAGLADLEFTGLIALADVPRDTSEALLSELRRCGILPVMLTGDHPETARAIALQLGWPEETVVVTGDELVTMDRRERVRALHGAGVVARVAPEQKLHVVEALQQAGRVVAMAGDGANDAAAIRAADVGVGIEARGSAAARNAADLVLTTGDLSVLVDAVVEGRALWRSVADAVSILIGGNAGEVGFSVLGTVLAGSSPLSTRQLLLVNLLTDMFPAMAVAVTPSDDPSTAAHAATGPMGLDVLGAPLLRTIRRRGVTTCLGAVAAYLIGRLTPGTGRRSTTMALCGVVGAQLVQTLSGRRHSPLVWTTALGSAAVLIALVQTPGVSHFFGCTPLGPVAWSGVLLAISLSALAPRLERLAVVRTAYEASSRLLLRLSTYARQARHLLHSGIARPVVA